MKDLQFLINKFPNKKWDWGQLSENPSIDMEFVEKYINKKWSYLYLSYNPNVNIEFVKKHIDEDWDWDVLSGNSGIKLKDIENNPEFDWHFKIMSFNPNLNIEFVKKHLDKEWNWEGISENSGIKLKDIENNPDLKWNWKGISRNQNVNIEFVKKHIDEAWDWDILSSNSGIKLKDIENNMDFSWDYNGLSYNKNLTFEFVKKYSDKAWNWEGMIFHMKITPDQIKENIETPLLHFDMEFFNYNPNITMEDIENNPELWELHKGLSNPNLTADFVISHLDELKSSQGKKLWKELGENYFEETLKKRKFQKEREDKCKGKVFSRHILLKKGILNSKKYKQLFSLFEKMCGEVKSETNIHKLKGMAESLEIESVDSKSKEELCSLIGAEILIKLHLAERFE